MSEEIKDFPKYLNKLLGTIISPNDTILDIGCGIGNPLQGLLYKELTGIDIMDYSKEYPGNFIQQDILDLSNFSDKCFDIVLCLDCIEHLDKQEGFKLILELERITRKKVFFLTPIKWDSNEHNTNDPDCWAYKNPYNLHKSHWKKEEFTEKGYEIISNSTYILALKTMQ